MERRSAGGMIASAVLVLLLLGSSSVDSIPVKQATSPGAFVGEGINALAVALLQDSQSSPAPNVAFSPLGHAAVLAALAEGATGTTQGELLAALRLPRDAPLGRAAYRAVLSRLQEKKKLNKPEFRSWFYVYKTAIQVEKSYADLLRDNYLMEVHDIEAPESELPSELADKRKPGLQQGSASNEEEIPEIPFDQSAQPSPSSASTTLEPVQQPTTEKIPAPSEAPVQKPSEAPITPETIAPTQPEPMAVPDKNNAEETAQQETSETANAAAEQPSATTSEPLSGEIAAPATELLPPLESEVLPAAEIPSVPEMQPDQQPASAEQQEEPMKETAAEPDNPKPAESLPAKPVKTEPEENTEKQESNEQQMIEEEKTSAEKQTSLEEQTGAEQQMMSEEQQKAEQPTAAEPERAEEQLATEQQPNAEKPASTEQQTAAEMQVPEEEASVEKQTSAEQQLSPEQQPSMAEPAEPEKQIISEVDKVQKPEQSQSASLESEKTEAAPAEEPSAAQKEGEMKEQGQTKEQEQEEEMEKLKVVEALEGESLPAVPDNYVPEDPNGSGSEFPEDNEMAESNSAETREAVTNRTPASPITAFNALYFRGAWATPFDGRQTAAFSVSPNNTVAVNMLSTVGLFRIGDVPELAATALELPYSDAAGRYSLLILLPDATEGSLDKLATTLSTRTLRSLGRYMSERLVHVQIPDFEIGYVSYPQAAFQKLGVKSALEPDLAEFPGISRSQRLFLQRNALAQLVRFRVDATSSSTNFLSTSSLGSNSVPAMEQPPPSLPSEAAESGASVRTGALQFRADRPFVFVLRDNVDKLTLVAGRIGDPSSRPIPPLLP